MGSTDDYSDELEPQVSFITQITQTSGLIILRITLNLIQ
jgi:hypothetical protein